MKDHSESLYSKLKYEKKETTSDVSVGFDVMPAVSPVVSKLRIRKLSGDALSSTRDPEDERVLNTCIMTSLFRLIMEYLLTTLNLIFIRNYSKFKLQLRLKIYYLNKNK